MRTFDTLFAQKPRKPTPKLRNKKPDVRQHPDPAVFRENSGTNVHHQSQAPGRGHLVRYFYKMGHSQGGCGHLMRYLLKIQENQCRN